VSHRRPEPIEVVDYDAEWPAVYERLRSRLVNALGELVLRVEHVGSTAVPGLAAKPIVDLYGVVEAEALPQAIARLEQIGYVKEGQLGVPGRVGFAWPAGESRHHLYLCAPDHLGLDELLRFRDHLRSHPADAAAYGELKRSLAQEHRNDREAYARAKTAFIEGILGKPHAVIRAVGLTKRFGDKRVLDGLDFDVADGDFLLVTGPNGAGKTTLLRLLAGLYAPTGGELAVTVERGRIGFIAHEPLVYRELTALENLDLFGRLYRVPERRERAGMLLERFGLWDARGERAGAFSRGMLQRLALCRAFLHEPTLLLLDEPFAALDQDGAELLQGELGDRGTVVAATHDPARLAPLATNRLALAA
jgi:GrpB-like predicted nucleotidyltransferase (UPF0157 family)/ABC-type nitrate/sulfonate/bicarbonate transport system ATPase subunit